MTKVLILDTEPNWIEFCQQHLDITTNPLDDYDVAIVSARLMHKFRFEKPFLVATSSPSTREAASAYRLGCRDYFTKDFTPEVLQQKIAQFQF